jgi:hypothetical protein
MARGRKPQVKVEPVVAPKIEVAEEIKPVIAEPKKPVKQVQIPMKLIKFMKES